MKTYMQKQNKQACKKLCSYTVPAFDIAHKEKWLYTLGSRMALKIESKNCWTCWKKNVGAWFANSLKTSTWNRHQDVHSETDR